MSAPVSYSIYTALHERPDSYLGRVRGVDPRRSIVEILRTVHERLGGNVCDLFAEDGSPQVEMELRAGGTAVARWLGNGEPIFFMLPNWGTDWVDYDTRG